MNGKLKLNYTEMKKSSYHYIYADTKTIIDLRRRSGIKRPNKARTWLNNSSAPTVWPFWSCCGIYTVSGIIPPLKNKATPWGVSELFQSFNQFTAEVWKMSHCTEDTDMRLHNLTLCMHRSLFSRAPNSINPLSMHHFPKECGGRKRSPALSSTECMQSSCYLMHELLHFSSC